MSWQRDFCEFFGDLAKKRSLVGDCSEVPSPKIRMDSSNLKLALLDMGGTINGILDPSDSVTMTSRVGSPLLN